MVCVYIMLYHNKVNKTRDNFSVENHIITAFFLYCNQTAIRTSFLKILLNLNPILKLLNNWKEKRKKKDQYIRNMLTAGNNIEICQVPISRSPDSLISLMVRWQIFSNDVTGLVRITGKMFYYKITSLPTNYR